MSLLIPTEAEVIESSNWFWASVCLLGVIMTIRWQRRDMLTKHTSQVVKSWMWVFIAAGINHGWFALSRHLADADSTWNAWMYEHRSLMVAATAAAFGYAAFIFFKLIEQIPDGIMIAIVGSIALFSYFIGVIH